jgi:hypothetical protein
MDRSAERGSLRLGIVENWPQFALLVLVNACVGGMVGLERTVVPLVATQEFGLTSDTLIFSFIVAFGIVKALANIASGMLPPANRATTLGWYRFWRDLGYPVGAVLAGIVSAAFGLVWAIVLAAALTLVSGLIAAAFALNVVPAAGRSDASRRLSAVAPR